MGVFRQFPYSNFHELNLDEIIKIIKNMLEEWAQYHAEWDTWMNQMNEDWSNYQEVMNTAWQNMQNFINNYFDNLDVQEEINTKIVALITSGEFAEIIEPFIPSQVSAWLAEHITEPEGVVIDTSLSVPGACADAKATGDAVTNIWNEIDVIENSLIRINPENELNMSAITTGKGITTNGAIIDNAETCITDFMPVTQGDIAYITGINDNGVFYSHTAVTAQRLALYDSDKHFVSYADWVNDYTVPSTGFVRLVLSNSWASWEIVSFTLNNYPGNIDEITEYFDSYFEPVEDVAARVTDSKLILIEPENKLNLNDPNLLLNKIIQTTGLIADNNTCFTSGFIKAHKGDVVTFATLNNGNFNCRLLTMVRLAFYDNDKHFISATEVFIPNNYEITENNCAYIRACLTNSALTDDVASITLNTIPAQASIEEYFEPYYSTNGESISVINSKKVLWLGTSIPTYGYPQLLGKYCNAHVDNKALGSSSIAKGVTSNITAANICGIRNIYGLFSLTQTLNEKQTLINNWSTIAAEIGSTDELTTDIENLALNYSSYEVILDPYLTGDKKVDFVVLNHGYNDSENAADVLAGNAAFDEYTMEGAYNWIIRHIWEIDPTIGIVIFGHYTNLSDAKEEALNKVAERWHIPYYKLSDDLGWSGVQTITTSKRVGTNGAWTNVSPVSLTIKNMWCGDGIHPLGVASVRIAEVATGKFDEWVKAYCNKDPHTSY